MSCLGLKILLLEDNKYLNFIFKQALINTSTKEEDRENLEQASGLLTTLKAMLERKFSGNMPKKKPWYVYKYSLTKNENLLAFH